MMVSKFKPVLSDDELDTLVAEYNSNRTPPARNLLKAIEQAVLAKVVDTQELRKDAERYRWLRDMIKNRDLTIAKVGSWSLESWSGDDPDHYIDAVMEKQE